MRSQTLTPIKEYLRKIELKEEVIVRKESLDICREIDRLIGKKVLTYQLKFDKEGNIILRPHRVEQKKIIVQSQEHST